MDWDTLSLKHKPLQKSPHLGVIEERVKQKPMCGIRAYGSSNTLEFGISTVRQVPGVSLPIEAYVNPWLIQILGTDLKNKEIINEHDRDIGYLSLKVAQMEKEIQELKSQLINKQKIEDLWRESEENANFLECTFGIDNKKIKTAEQAFLELGGILKDCTKDGIDSVSLVHSIRGE
jgi:hypothetical protein